MRQASGEDAVDFLIRVSNAVQILGNDWKELMTPGGDGSTAV